MPRLTGCTDRTLIFDDGSTPAVPDWFKEAEIEDGCVSLWVRGSRGGRLCLLIGTSKDVAEREMNWVLDEMNRLDRRDDHAQTEN